VISSLECASGCKIETEFNLKVQKVTFFGTQMQIDLAVSMARVLIEGGSLDPFSYVAEHAVQRPEPSSSDSPCDEGCEQVRPCRDVGVRLARWAT